MEVEGRRYTLNALDNIVLPRGVAHAALNASSSQRPCFMWPWPTDLPSRTIVDKFFSRRAMPEDSTGKAGAEYLTRHRTAKRFEAGKGASFIDFFNRDLIPGIEMSGGYGLFQPGGRLPAHVHDFDESICIVQGEATCVVEGRKYTLSGCATALQPRGRVHYFINQSNAPMAMIWVYGGPAPGAVGRGRALRHGRGEPLEVTGERTMSGQTGKKFVVTMTADFFDADGRPKYRDLGLSVFDGHSHIERRTFAEHRPRSVPTRSARPRG